MIVTEEDEDGVVNGSVVCGNDRCRKVLGTFEGDENEPAPDEAGYRLFRVQARVLYVDEHGRPLRVVPQGNAFEALGVPLFTFQDDRVVGYRLVPGSGLFLEDFCSDVCASQYVDGRKEFSLCFRMQADGTMTFVCHRPDRFATEQVRIAQTSASSKATQASAPAAQTGAGPDSDVARGEALLRQDQLEQAAAAFQAALHTDPNCAGAHLRLGLVFTRLGRDEDALAEYEAAVGIDLGASESHYQLGIAYERLGFWKDAAGQFEATLQIDPVCADAHLHLGDVYRRMGDLEEAMGEYKVAMRAGHLNSQAEQAMALARSESAAQKRPLDYYGKRLELTRGVISLEAGKAPPILALMTCLYLACPMGQLDQSAGRLERCGRPLEIPLGLAPSAMVCPVCYSLLFVDDERESRRYDDADFRTSLKEGYVVAGYATYPDHKAQGALPFRIRQRTSGGRPLVAIPMDDETGRMLRLSETTYAVIPTSLSLHELVNMMRAPTSLAESVLQSAFVAYSGQRYWEAIGFAQRALVIQPKSARAHQLVADSLDELGMLDAAVSEYDEALRLDPGSSMALNNLGLVYNKQGRTQEAIQACELAIRRDPGNIDAHLSLAGFYCGLQRWGDAAQQFLAVVRTKPDHGIARYNLGVAYQQLGRLVEAVRELEAAARLMPDDGETHGTLGQALWQQGRAGDAVREWQAAVRLGYAPAKQWLAQAGRR